MQPKPTRLSYALLSNSCQNDNTTVWLVERYWNWKMTANEKHNWRLPKLHVLLLEEKKYSKWIYWYSNPNSFWCLCKKNIKIEYGTVFCKQDLNRTIYDSKTKQHFKLKVFIYETTVSWIWNTSSSSKVWLCEIRLSQQEWFLLGKKLLIQSSFCWHINDGIFSRQHICHIVSFLSKVTSR